MGCGSSKVDDLAAVGVCRERCSFLDEAIHQRYSLSAVHFSYFNSLKSIGHSLHLFIQHSSSSPLSSPLPLKSKQQLPSIHHESIDDDAASHLHFHSDDDDDDDDDDEFHSHLHTIDDDDDDDDEFHSHHLHDNNNHNHLSFPSPPTSYINYMKKQPTPSIVYQQTPINPDTVYMGGDSSSSYYPNYPYPPPSSSYYSHPTPPPIYGSSSSSSSKPPPPPPSPPRSSPWDFLNFFNTDNTNYYSQYNTPSRDSREVREDEGIPDLEDEDYHQHPHPHSHPLLNQNQQQQQQQHQQQNNKKAEAAVVVEDEDHIDEEEEEEEEEVEYEVHVVDKKVVQQSDNTSSNKHPPAAGNRDPLEVAKQIELHFQRASDSGSQVAKILEVGKLPYHPKNTRTYQASSKILHAVAPSLSLVSSQPSTSKTADSTDLAATTTLDFDLDLTMRSHNLSSTLQKLYLWEKKLYNEVKAEEKMRVLHDRKCRKLKRMDERGADFHKVDSTRALIRSLSTKIRMAIQVVDRISMTINKIRDEELWPQLKELIQGLTRMWKSMLECHHCQCEAIKEARILGSVGSRKKGGDSHLMATKQLEQELINWTFQFSSWISAQKGYVRALNNWLLKCLLYEPEETPDGIVPFSPGRIGAPPIFVICNQWSQALDRISEKEVVDSMHVFTMSVLQVWEQDKLEMHRQMVDNKDLERKVRNLDRDDQKLQKQIQALERKVIMASGEGKGLSVSENIKYQSDKGSSSLQASLQRIFEAMERFTDESVRAYDELLQRSEEVSATRDHA
ncbi:hypothetical protein Lalb_Chr04g0246971 [Lupinus albus]|uniref:DUF632 domain-containing protein n=1 Tax=Lupinus albus TaxID=3870 RepID=A0A6A4QKD4_LUPAL|nr:hypothetical protein Lalb_Chr04g0246971 [Lupinus albus]